MLTRAKRQKMEEMRQKKVRLRANVANNDVGEFENKGKPDFNSHIPADLRLDNVENVAINYKQFQPKVRDGKLQQLKWLNIGTKAVINAIKWFRGVGEKPKWLNLFEGRINLRRGSHLFFDDMRILSDSQKRDLVKYKFYHPKYPVSIQGIYDQLDDKYANVTRKDVARIVKSLAQWQLTRRRFKPKGITSHFNAKKPGILCCDTFQPSKINGWSGKRYVFTVADYWSRYVGVYTLEKKSADIVERCFIDYCRKFTEISKMFPRRMFMDKGTELAKIEGVMERFRQKRDGKQPMVLKSLTGMPVGYIEQVNADVQNRMQKSAILTDEPEQLTHFITYAINHQKRIRKGNLSPIEMLNLNFKERAKVNREYRNQEVEMGDSSLKPLEVGDTVRFLTMTRKEQEKSMNPSHKGFGVKWSKTTHKIIRKRRVKRNYKFFQYTLEGITNPKWNRYFYRHELQKLEHGVDDKPGRMPIRLNRKLYEDEIDWN